MSQVCRLTINGDVVAANPGDLLLDAALMNGIELPHDCRSGYCGTCRVRVLAGRCLGGASDISNVVHACQTRVISDLTVVLEKVPEIVQVSGEIAGLVNVAPDVVEVCIESREPFDYLPGQYLAVQFRGFPKRYYSPTGPLQSSRNPELIRFHVRRLWTKATTSAGNGVPKSGFDTVGDTNVNGKGRIGAGGCQQPVPGNPARHETNEQADEDQRDDNLSDPGQTNRCRWCGGGRI